MSDSHNVDGAYDSACNSGGEPMTPEKVDRLKSGVASAASFSTAISDDPASESTTQGGGPTARSSSSADGSRSGVSSVPIQRKRLSNAWTLEGSRAAVATLQANDPRNTDLDYFSRFGRLDARDLMGHFTKVRDIAGCCRGEGQVELHSWKQSEQQEHRLVVVKRARCTRVLWNLGKEVCEHALHFGADQRDMEDTRNEIGVYCLLVQRVDVPQYILQMHAVFQEGLDVWLVLEHADGGDLFTTLQVAGGRVPGNQVTVWMWQLLQAVYYLHRLGIGHRDISIENILLMRGMAKLMDFGQAVQTRSSAGAPFRYFQATGKPYYLAPECYVSTSRHIEVEVQPGQRPGDIVFAQSPEGQWGDLRLPGDAAQGERCVAEPWGYTVEKSDIFACGVCHFIAATGMPPWRRANSNDVHFNWIQEHGVAALLRSWQQSLPDDQVRLLQAMISLNPAQRPDARALLASPYFSGMAGHVIPRHGNRMEVQSVAAEAEPETVQTVDAEQEVLVDGAQVQAMQGDFYHEPDIVRRSTGIAVAQPADALAAPSAAVAAAALPSCTALSSAGGFVVEGDPYPEIACVRSYDAPSELVEQAASLRAAQPTTVQQQHGLPLRTMAGGAVGGAVGGASASHFRAGGAALGFSVAMSSGGAHPQGLSAARFSGGFIAKSTSLGASRDEDAADCSRARKSKKRACKSSTKEDQKTVDSSLGLATAAAAPPAQTAIPPPPPPLTLTRQQRERVGRQEPASSPPHQQELEKASLEETCTNNNATAAKSGGQPLQSAQYPASLQLARSPSVSGSSSGGSPAIAALRRRRRQFSDCTDSIPAEACPLPFLPSKQRELGRPHYTRAATLPRSARQTHSLPARRRRAPHLV